MEKTMKKFLLFLLVFTFAMNLCAEEPKKITEIGLTTSRPLYNSYNFTLKFGDERSVIRISSLSLSDYMRNINENRIIGNDTLSIGDSDLSTSFAFALGKEIRKEIDRNFEFRYGLDFTFSHSLRIDDTNYDTTYTFHSKQNSWSPGLQLVLGFNYVLKDRIVFGVEFLPKLYYSYSRYDYEKIYADPSENDIYETEYLHYWRFNISTLALFSISYRF
jgi:hypothetical protein